MISRLFYVNLFLEVVSFIECCILFMFFFREEIVVGEGRKEVEVREWGVYVRESEVRSKRKW